MALQLFRPPGPLTGAVALSGSKSISNRVLLIRALCAAPFPIYGLADAKDTRLMQSLLSSESEVYDAGAAGTTFRFLTAFLSLKPGVQILTGTERMKQRPIGVLVNALRELGADIQYIEQEGYPPLRIGPPNRLGANNRISISAGTSSQYISALLLIAPALPNGLTLTLEDTVVSRPYIEMTLQLMQQFGVQHTWENHSISVLPQTYQPREFTVEADWSAASYYYAMAAFAPEADLELKGLFAQSVQGDAVLADMMRHFGVETTFGDNTARLRKTPGFEAPAVFEWDFLKCPDLAQTLAVVCAGTGVQGLFTGLETLRIKETDRIAALRAELQKVGVSFHEMPQRVSQKTGKRFFLTEGQAQFPAQAEFETYEDHRMAMAFAPLAMQAPIGIREPEVVEKSYPQFWEHLRGLGFAIQGEY
jgi:3-phosphoshikimate 1-carboxyvinyltransferase